MKKSEELTAVVLCAKIGKHVEQQLRIPISVTYWTDSLVVLHCIRNTIKRFERFVSNSLPTIHELSTASQWKYVKSKQNPADHASCGLSLDDSIKIKKSGFTDRTFYGRTKVAGQIHAKRRTMF
ncbi:unnamed protein product [Schistosoma bovis]|nr:unnamed protein product [Schistosoma bovis]